MTQKVGGVEFDVDVDVSGVKSASSKVQSDLSKVESSFNQVDSAAVRTSNTITSSSARGAKGLSNLRGAAGQLGFQMQDIAVQAQMGTNALVILGQQGSQIAGIFGPTGAIVGGVIAVGAAIASVMVPSMMDGGDAAEDLSEKLKELSKTNELTINQQKFLKQVEAEEAEEKKKKIAELEKEIAKQEALASRLNESASGYGRMAKASRVRIENGSLIEMRKEVERLKAEIDTINEDFGAIKIDPEKASQAMDSYSRRLEVTQQSLNMEGEILAAANARQFALMQSGGNEQLALLDEQIAARMARREFERQQEISGFESQREDILKNESLNGEQKAALIEQLRQLEKQAKEQHENELTNIEMDAAEARRKIAQAEAKEKLSLASSMFGNLSSLMNTESKKLFEIGKIAAYAETIVNGAMSAQLAYAGGLRISGGNPAVGAAFAATSLAATAVQLKQIQSAQFGSASAGQSYSGGTVTNNTTSSATQETRRVVDLNFTGNAPTNARELVEILNEAAGDNVQFNFGG